MTAHPDESAFLAAVINAEATALTRLAAAIETDSGPHWGAALDLLAATDGHVVVCGMGKSGLVGQKISATLASLGQPSHFVHPAEAVHGDLGRIRRGDSVMLLSFSGETAEVVDLALILKADGIRRLGVSAKPDSSLARACDAHIPLGNITEACPHNLAPTASTTAMMAVGDALALALARRRNFAADDFHRHHPGGMLGAGLRSITEILRFRVGENLPCLSQSLKVREAIAQAGAGRRAGAMVVVDAAGALAGILTDGDIRRLLNEHGESMLGKSMDEVMTRSPRSLPSSAVVADAVRMVREQRIDEIPVVDAAGRPIGLVDVQDLVAMKVVSE
ncbi:MAG: KpsF/GutQ family sugar-phosphate isomerase [Planctomycetota bacterium]|nr:KpsF/GutQ family sugar-phosphate isomerase [Planctomycetota bacterium]MDA1105591.1 KpsF/GutQ family sugar-phosphate isomerase [Planctomycetota bacterium]